jgi:hypothetical protein
MRARALAAAGLLLVLASACLSPPDEGAGDGDGAEDIDGGADPPVVLLVVPDEATLVADNEAFRDRLESLGFSVALRDDDACGPADALDKSLVMFARGTTVTNVRYGCAMEDSPTALFLMSTNIWLHYLGGEATEAWWVDGTVFTIDPATAGHPLAGGLSGGLALFVDADDDQHGTISTVSQDGIIVARSGVNDDPSIFAYDTGAVMPGDSEAADDVAKARRVGFLGNHELHVGNWSDDAWVLFDAAVLWAADAGTTQNSMVR